MRSQQQNGLSPYLTDGVTQLVPCLRPAGLWLPFPCEIPSPCIMIPLATEPKPQAVVPSDLGGWSGLQPISAATAGHSAVCLVLTVHPAVARSGQRASSWPPAVALGEEAALERPSCVPPWKVDYAACCRRGGFVIAALACSPSPWAGVARGSRSSVLLWSPSTFLMLTATWSLAEQSLCQILEASVNIGSRSLDVQLDALLGTLHPQVRAGQRAAALRRVLGGRGKVGFL